MKLTSFVYILDLSKINKIVNALFHLKYYFEDFIQSLTHVQLICIVAKEEIIPFATMFS